MGTSRQLSQFQISFLLKLAIGVAAIFIVNVLVASAASASMATNTRLHGGNAWNYCHAGHPPGQPGPYAKGMVWISNVESDYYSEAVNIGAATNSVRVSIRGAVNGCYTTWPGNRDMYAVDVTTSYLSAMSGTTLYRGRITAPGGWSWTSEGSKLYGNLNVSNVALCGASSLLTGSSTETITISISRRQQQYNMSGQLTFDSPVVGTEFVPITVTRSCPTYNFELQPSVDITDGTGIETPQTRTVTGYVTNAGPTISMTNTPWQLTKVVYGPGDAIPEKSGGTRTSAAATTPCDFFTGERECDGTTANGTRAAVYPVNNPQSHSGSFDINSYDVGTRVCFALSVRQYNQTAAGDGWRHSDLMCLIAGKKPKVNVLGGDLYVGRAITGVTPTSSGRVITSTTRNALGLFGSWGEYGVVARGPVEVMSSGSGYVNGVADHLDLLTFTNQGNVAATCGSSLGCYSQAGSLPNVASRFTISPDTPVLGSGSLSAVGQGIYTASGTLTIDTSTIQRNKWIVINAPTASVVISGDITYEGGSFTSLEEIPQLIIIANTITINQGVRTVDSWLVAPGTVSGSTVSGGVIRTCEVAPSSISASVCATPLTINGPIIANQLMMLRTGGSEPNERAGDPAEVFNFRPDAYLWALGQGEASGRVTTVSTKELPPRY